jgi:heme/copper-type cytochrome/quinol oxidase subunit 3
MALAGILTIIASLIGWHWPTEAPTTEEEERAFEAEHGVEVWTTGSRSVGRSGMMLLLLILWTALASFLFSYFYIRLENGEWPLDNIPLPNLTWAGLSAALVLVSGGAVYWAIRGIRAGSNRRLALGLGFALLLGAAAIAIQVFDFSQLNFRWDTNAYGSAFYMLAFNGFAVLGGGLIFNALVQFWAWRGQFTARRHVMAENITMYWYSAILLWLISFGVIYLAPYLI